MGIFSKAKDRVVEQAALSYLNSQLLAPYGKATRLSLDSKAKTIHIEAELKGETGPIEIEVLDYQITRDGERYFVLVKEIRTSREWLTTLAANHFCNLRFELPGRIGQFLKLAL